ncbi:hypothetical protein QFZ29_000225 [Agromyces albus]|nr:hypothetical protein [Agromyces albus]
MTADPRHPMDGVYIGVIRTAEYRGVWGEPRRAEWVEAS